MFNVEIINKKSLICIECKDIKKTVLYINSENSGINSYVINPCVTSI
jgi:Holliday junction resolvase